MKETNNSKGDNMSVNDFGGRIAVRTDINNAAWHNLGGFVGSKSAKEIMNGFEGGIPNFTKRPVYIPDEVGGYMATGDFALMRSPTSDDPQFRQVGYCTKNYNIVQPTDIGEAFDEKVGKPIETLGFLNHGERMFATWEMPKSSFVVGKDDEVKLFGTVLAGFDARVAISVSLLTFRVVCENTFNMAQEEIKGKKSEDGSAGRVWVGRHNSPNIKRDLNAWMGHVEKSAERRVALAENWFNKMALTPVDNKNVLQSLIAQIYPMPKEIDVPDELLEERKAKMETAVAKADEDRMNIEKLFGGEDKTTNGATAWDLFNNVTFYENHMRLSKKDKFNSVVFGNRAKTMNDALSVLVNYSLGGR